MFKSSSGREAGRAKILALDTRLRRNHYVVAALGGGGLALMVIEVGSTLAPLSLSTLMHTRPVWCAEHAAVVQQRGARCLVRSAEGGIDPHIPCSIIPCSQVAGA